ncbi:DUF423 domain-containing protein [Zooshikella marina]|uniref:DUF423 domain-containing protein n=1 Tax=Zooshikella ganghwensis TaxID=202772 RepID=UPI001BAE7ED4|nr:DUF423 domain-containing protein [Zooshikella ganghwensis]MBU2706379.1 DUF423 domain-containing protein [Zooshikella ganghwensis]
MNYRWLHVSGVSGLLAVAFGAFGAHSLQPSMTSELQAVYETAVNYHFYHTFALLAVALLGAHIKHSMINWVGYCFLMGVLLFSGSLYLLSITGIRWLGMVTPLGGILLLNGWLLLVVLARKHARLRLKAD